jgi:hypothetical protein
LKALTIRQPWAWLIVSGKKNVENRSWPTKYRGKFLVHAAIAFSEIPLEEIEAQFHVKLPPREQMLRGGIIGSCELVDCVTVHRSKWFEGPFGFVLTNARPRRFERVGGKLGFWDYASPRNEFG